MTQNPNIGIFISTLSVKGGAEVVAARLATELNAPIYTLRYNPEAFEQEFHEKISDRVVNIARKSDFTEEEIDNAIQSDTPTIQFTPTASDLNAIDIADLDKITSDALISVDNPGTVLAFRSGKPFLTYLHHIAKGSSDYFFEQLDQTEGLVEKLRFTYERWRYARQVKGTTKHADYVLANSVRTRERAKDRWGVSEDNISVVYPPVDTETYTPGTPDRMPFDFDYYLAPQRLEPYKHINVIVEAAKQAEEHVVFVGTGRMEEYVRREAHYSDYVHSVGYVEDEYLRDLYRGATATLQGAFREDFGIVPVESLACGTPCLLPASGGFNETIGDGHGAQSKAPYQTQYGYLLDPEEFSVETLAKMMQVFDPADYDEQQLVDRARQFGVDRFIHQLMEHFTEHVLDKTSSDGSFSATGGDDAADPNETDDDTFTI